MVEFFQNYGILLILGLALAGLFAWIGRKGHPRQVKPADRSRQSETNNQDTGNQ